MSRRWVRPTRTSGRELTSFGPRVPVDRRLGLHGAFFRAAPLPALAREFPAIAGRIYFFEALAAWRPSQGMYIFDRVLRDELSRTVADGPIPGDVLLRIPEWCIYIIVTEGPLTNWGLNGIFAFLSCDETKREAALRFLLDMDDDRLLATLPLSFEHRQCPGERRTRRRRSRPHSCHGWQEQGVR